MELQRLAMPSKLPTGLPLSHMMHFARVSAGGCARWVVDVAVNNCARDDR
jgi:hypothetical protein